MREGITPPGMAHYRGYRFSPAVRAGGLLHLSGQLGLASLTPPELATGAAGQIAAAFELQRQVLAEAGRGWDAVIEIMSFHVAGPEGGFVVGVGRFRPVRDHLVHLSRRVPALKSAEQLLTGLFRALCNHLDATVGFVRREPRQAQLQGF